MSEWVKAKGESGKELKEVEKRLRSYSYREPKDAEATDREVRKAVAESVNGARDILFPFIEAAYTGSDMATAGAMEEVMQWLDVFLLEAGLPLVWSDKAVSKDFARLIRADAALLKGCATLGEMIRKLKGAAGKSAEKECAKAKEYITELLSVYKARRHALGG